MYQDSRYNYELPSIYKAGPVEERDSFDIQPSATQNQGLIDHDPQGYPSPPSSDNPSNVNDRHLAWLLLLTPLSMLIFTVIPAVASFPYVDTMTTGDAIFRLIDPVSYMSIYIALLWSLIMDALGGALSFCVTDHYIAIEPVHHVLCSTITRLELEAW